MHIGPEPTSDKFMALIHGSASEGNKHDSKYKKRNQKPTNDEKKPKSIEKIIKGNTMTVMPELHYYGLSQFGSAFLNHFDGSVVDSPLLKHMNICLLYTSPSPRD